MARAAARPLTLHGICLPDAQEPSDTCGPEISAVLAPSHWSAGTEATRARHTIDRIERLEGCSSVHPFSADAGCILLCPEEKAPSPPSVATPGYNVATAPWRPWKTVNPTLHQTDYLRPDFGKATN
ncbi:hypothetical protein NDU88_005285 [Pleurodeles waltl]|uniref:Uncharacterized protein n=1 Tax=Pleurodeles waltl TaxID=8319 RepID=A0AAV7SLF9_PLEWA|nr:hypothetical protein NDU88_005285 [Pleurodeles waltl]